MKRNCLFGVSTAILLLSAYCIASTGTKGCYRMYHAEEYNGTWRETKSGLECQHWDKQYPHEHSMDPDNFPEKNLCEAKNYCRDPDWTGYLWCYTMSQDVRWEACDIPVCQEETGETEEEEQTENAGCYRKYYAEEYSGTLRETKSGLECQRWDEQYPHEHSMDPHNFPEKDLCEAKNYCRDPDYTGYPWCYTMSEDVRWEACDVPVCQEETEETEETEEEEQTENGEYDCYDFTEEEIYSGRSDKEICEINEYRKLSECSTQPECEQCRRCCQRKDCVQSTQRLSEYTGTWHRTRSGFQCQSWIIKYPYDNATADWYQFPDDSVIAARNYCRDPDGTGFLWCYTGDPYVTWESCGIEYCY